MKTRRETRLPQRLDLKIEFKPKSSAQRVREYRERQKQKKDYDHEKVKEETRKRVAAIRAKRPKYPLGRKCKDESCGLHPVSQQELCIL